MKTVDGVPEGISLSVRPSGRWLLSQAGVTLRRLVASQVLHLATEGLGVLPPDAVRSLAQATVELVRAMLISACRPEEQTGSDIGREALRYAVKQYIRRHLNDPGMTPAVIARAHHVSLRHLYNVWDEPVSLARWISQRRLEAAPRTWRIRAGPIKPSPLAAASGDPPAPGISPGDSARPMLYRHAPVPGPFGR